MTTGFKLPVGLEEQEPDAAFLSGLRRMLGFNPQTSIYGRASQRQAPAFGSTFRFNELLNPGQGDRANPFESFVANSGGIGNVRNQASNLFGQLRARGPGQGIREQFQQPTEEQASDLGNLARTALGKQISPLALGMLNLPSGNDVRNEFLGQNAQSDFIEFLRQRIGFGLL